MPPFKHLDEDTITDLYLRGGLSTRRIGRTFEVDKATILSRLRKNRIPIRHRANPFKFSTMNSDLAYLLGVRYGDGWVIPNRFGVGVKDEEFLNEIAKRLEGIGLNFRRYHELIVVNSKDFATWLRSLKIQDLTNMLMNNQNKAAFVKGFYDSEGSLYTCKRGYHHIHIYNNSKPLLLIALEFLRGLQIFGRLYKSDRIGRRHWFRDRYVTCQTVCWQVSIERQNDVRRFSETIGSSIPRKVVHYGNLVCK